MVWLTSFSVKEGVKPEKRGFQPMRKKLGEKFGVVFSFAVVVTDTELRYSNPSPSGPGALLDDDEVIALYISL